MTRLATKKINELLEQLLVAGKGPIIDETALQPEPKQCQRSKKLDPKRAFWQDIATQELAARFNMKK